jgi:membrane protease YdiL (CAAX protease family)
MEFNAVVMHATQICGLVFALAYLARVRPLSRQSLGLSPAGDRGPARFMSGFAWGAVILACLIAVLLMLGIYHAVPGRDTGPGAVLALCAKAVLTGLAVGLFEETVFRGAILNGLAQRTSPAAALVTVSLLYAAVHFIHYPPTADPGWLSAARQFPAAYLAIFNPAQIDAFLALFVLGLLLGLMRLGSGDIIACIGLHAGLVTMIKISRYFYHYTGGTQFDFLVSVHDRRLGYLALLLLCMATAAYYLRRRPIPGTTGR